MEIKKLDSWEVVVFMINGKANHVGLSVPEHGLGDLSLLGARLVSWDGPSLPKGERLKFEIQLDHPDKALEFLQKPGLLCRPILEQEKKQRGWHLTEDAPDYVRVLRDTRSKNENDMNCVEWIVRAMELGGLEMPDDVMTPTELLNWCRGRN